MVGHEIYIITAKIIIVISRATIANCIPLPNNLNKYGINKNANIIIFEASNFSGIMNNA